MKFNRILFAFIFVTLVASAAFGKGSRATVSFPLDTQVNGTTIKKGTYDLKFDETTNELSVLKNGKEIAKASGRAEKREKKADQTSFRTRIDGSNRHLVGVIFGGSDEEIVIG
jgi:hypothetical protein